MEGVGGGSAPNRTLESRTGGELAGNRQGLEGKRGKEVAGLACIVYSLG